MNKLPEYRRRRRALSVPAGDGAMTVDDELRELADHELNVMRERLEELVCRWDQASRSHREMADVIAKYTGRNDTRADGYATMLGVCVLHLRNVLAGRDAEDDGT